MIRLLSAVVLMILCVATPVRAADEIGAVVRVQGVALASSPEGERVLAAGDGLSFGETVSTGEGARLELRFADGTGLTLGESAEIALDSFVYEPGGGSFDLDVLAGAFALVTGDIGKADPEAVRVTTPVSTIGIRGTSFWGGPLDGDYGVLLLDGAVVVATAGGEVVLDEEGEGTTILGADQPPGEPTYWAATKVQRAVATISFAE